MALVEIDEFRLTALTNVASTIDKMLSNPKTRRKILEAQKELNPNLAIPEIDEVDRGVARYNELDTKITESRKQLEAVEARIAERERLATLTAQWEGGRSKLRKSGWTDESIPGIEKLMEERCIADHEAAAALYEKLNPPAASGPLSPGGNRFDLFSAKKNFANDDAMKALMAGNDDAFLSQVIPQTLNEMRYGKQ